MFRIHIFLICFLLTSSAYATMSEIIANNNFVFGFSAGPTWTTGNEKQTINLEPDVVKTYTADDSSNGFPTVELFVGMQQAWFIDRIQQPVLTQLGIAVAAAGNAKLSGDIWEDADPAFDNFDYAYKVNHAHIALAGRLIGNNHRFIEPYLSASLGVGFNRAYDYSSSPKTTAEVAAPPFESNTTTTFTYTLGVGFQTALAKNLQAAIGYEFADWGKVQLSPAAGQTTNQALTLNHLYAHQLQFSLFYTVC